MKVVDKILKQITPERVKKEIAAIQKIKLPPGLQKWVKEYEQVGERDEFLWKWVFKSSKIITFSTVFKKYKSQLFKDKTLVFMFDTLLDDIADKKRNKILLNELLKIPRKRRNIEWELLSAEKKRYLRFTIKVWDTVFERIKQYPKYEEFKEVFDYDIAQLLNTMRYAYLVNKAPYLINTTEYWVYFPHNMCAMICGTMDLMNSPNFNIQEIRQFRELFWRAQKMARIGNWISTWEREIKEGDFTSGSLAYALDSGVLSIADLKSLDEKKIIQKIKNARIEKRLLQEWEDNYDIIEEKTKPIGSKENSAKFLKGLRYFFILHLISKGYK